MLLSPLFDVLFPARESELRVRAASYESLAKRYQARPIELAGSGMSCTALLPYHEPLVQAFIIEAKFHNNRKAQSFLGAILAEYVRTLPCDICILPIPLSPTRLRARGYNQVLRIAETAAHVLATDHTYAVRISTSVLRRIRNTKPQTTLDGVARRKNMAGAFVAEVPETSFAYLILDDVCTTGATISAAAYALRQAQIRNLLLVCLAH